MIETLSQLFQRINIDARRVGILLAIVAVLSAVDGLVTMPSSLAYVTSILTSTSIVLLVAAISHITRRVLFPGIDLKAFAKESLAHPVAAAIVFMAVCVVLTALIVSNIMLLS